MIIKVTIPTITTISTVNGCSHSGNRYTNDFTTVLFNKKEIDIDIIECEDDCYCQQPDILTQLQNQSSIEDMKEVFNKSIYGKIKYLLKCNDYDQIQSLSILEPKSFIKNQDVYEMTVHLKDKQKIYITSYYDDDIMCCSEGTYKHEIPQDLLLNHPRDLDDYRYNKLYTFIKNQDKYILNDI